MTTMRKLLALPGLLFAFTAIAGIDSVNYDQATGTVQPSTTPLIFPVGSKVGGYPLVTTSNAVLQSGSYPALYSGSAGKVNGATLDTTGAANNNTTFFSTQAANNRFDLNGAAFTQAAALVYAPLKSNNLSDLPSPSTALANLGGIGTSGSSNSLYAGLSGNSAATTDPRMLTNSPLSITYTGAWAYSYPFFLTPPDAVQLSTTNTMTGGTGKWIEGFTYAEPNATVNVGRLTSITFNDLVGVRGNLAPQSLIFCTSYSFPALTTVEGNLTFSAEPMSSLILSTPLLTTVAGNVTFSMMSLSSVDFSSLTTVGGSFSMGTGATFPATLSFLALVRIGTTLTLGPSSQPSALIAPNLTYLGMGMSVNSCAIVSCTLPKLAIIGSSGIQWGGNSFLQTLLMPNLMYCEGVLNITSDSSLSNFSLGTPGTLMEIQGAVVLSSCSLTQASVDGVVSALASLTGSNGTTMWNAGLSIGGGTNASPTASGTSTQAGASFSGSTSTCTVSWSGHGFSTGDLLNVSGITTLTNANGYHLITVDNANQFHFTITSQTATGGGTATVKRYSTTNPLNILVTRGTSITTN